MKMTKLIYSIWALVLNSLGINVFRTCFTDGMEDEYGDYALSGPPITSIIFASGVYTITCNLKLYPSTFRKPIPVLMGLYEFLVTAFILEFSLACIWAPIDIHIYTTLTRVLSQALVGFGCSEIATWIILNKFPMTILCFATSIGFFLITLHVTRSVDFSIYFECGAEFFATHVKRKIVQKLAKELPKLDEIECSGCRGRSRKRSRKSRY